MQAHECSKSNTIENISRLFQAEVALFNNGMHSKALLILRIAFHPVRRGLPADSIFSKEIPARSIYFLIKTQ